MAHGAIMAVIRPQSLDMRPHSDYQACGHQGLGGSHVNMSTVHHERTLDTILNVPNNN